MSLTVAPSNSLFLDQDELVSIGLEVGSALAGFYVIARKQPSDTNLRQVNCRQSLCPQQLVSCAERQHSKHYHRDGQQREKACNHQDNEIANEDTQHNTSHGEVAQLTPPALAYRTSDNLRQNTAGAGANHDSND